MKKSSKRLLAILGLGLTALLVSSCTQSFCSNKEKARVMYVYEPGITTFVSDNNPITINEGTDYEYTITPVELDGYNNVYYASDKTFAAEKLNSYFKKAVNSGLNIGTTKYWQALDLRVVEEATALYLSFNAGESKSSIDATKLNNDVLGEFGYIKFLSTEEKANKLFEWLDKTNYELSIDPAIGPDHMPSNDFIKYYKSQLKAAVANFRTCITTVGGKYGAIGTSGTPITMEAKSWGDAWNKGFIEGLLVYPVALMVDFFSNAFGYHEGATSAVPQLLALLLVTVIVRGLLILITLKPTMNQQKMSLLQPELAKLQEKYPDSKTNRSQQMRLAQEQQALYKKYKINPLSSLLVIVFQFPIFIGVWNGLSGSAVLASGQILNMRLSDSISSIITGYIAKGGFTANVAGWWTALVLFILMSAAQIVSSRLPMWMQKSREKKVAHLGKNPSQASNNRTMKIVSWVMVIMIIIMGFSLPSAMGVYWLVGALISIVQTIIMQNIMAKNQKNKKHKKGAKR